MCTYAEQRLAPLSIRHGVTPREFSRVQFHEVEHAGRRPVSEFGKVIRHAVIPPQHVKLRHRRQVVDEVCWNSQRLKTVRPSRKRHIAIAEPRASEKTRA